MFGRNKTEKLSAEKPRLETRPHTSNKQMDDAWKVIRSLRESLREMDHRVSLLERRRNADAAAASRSRAKQQDPETPRVLRPGERLSP